MSEVELCKFCNKNQFKYACPKCNILYCSVECYKSPKHLKCSEEFYKKCVEDEIAASSSTRTNSDESKRLREILTRMQEIEDDDFDIDPLKYLDSDDDDDDEEDVPSLSERLEGIDINDADEIWGNLTDAERKDFEDMIKNQEIINLLPKYKPWWSEKNSKLVVVGSNEDEPKICENIAPFSSLCSKEPSTCIHNNVWNVITSYVCTVRFFNGEHRTSALEAANYLVLLSANLRANTNFYDAEEAMMSVETILYEENMALPELDFIDLQKDIKKIMAKLDFKLRALSDVLCLLKLAKEQLVSNKNKAKNSEFTEKFEGQLVNRLTKSKLSLIIKKVEFLLSYVNRSSTKNVFSL